MIFLRLREPQFRSGGQTSGAGENVTIEQKAIERHPILPIPQVQTIRAVGADVQRCNVALVWLLVRAGYLLYDRKSR